MAKCMKYPNTDLVIRQGKRKGHYVVCPLCKPDPAETPATAPAAAEKKTGGAPEKPGDERRWYDREIFG